MIFKSLSAKGIISFANLRALLNRSNNNWWVKVLNVESNKCALLFVLYIIFERTDMVISFLKSPSAVSEYTLPGWPDAETIHL